MDGNVANELPQAVPIHAPWGNERAWHAFLRNLVATRPDRRRSPGLNGYAARLGIGEIDVRNPGFVQYRPEHFAEAARLLIAQPSDVPPPVAHIATSQRRRCQPLADEQDEDLVAVAQIHGDMGEGVRFWAMESGAAARLPHDVMIVCQHLIGLRAVSSYAWMPTYLKERTALAIFRGGTAGFGRLGCERAMEASGAPTLALFDCDPKGLAAARRLPRLEALCLPPSELLAQELAAARPLAHFARTLRANGADLEDCQHAQIAAAWALVKRYGTGLPQTAFPRGVG